MELLDKWVHIQMTNVSEQISQVGLKQWHLPGGGNIEGLHFLSSLPETHILLFYPWQNALTGV